MMAVGALFAALATGRARVLHRADQGAGEREVLRAVRGLRRRPGRHDHRGLGGQPGRPIICCTAEILAGVALRGAPTPTSARWCWTSSTTTATRNAAGPGRCRCWNCACQFVLMSATLGDVDFFADDLRRRTGREAAVLTRRATSRAADFSLLGAAARRDLEELVHHPPGAGVRRALHPGGRAGARTGADQHQLRQPRAEGRDRRGRSAGSVSPPGSARRCPAWCATASACTTPACCPSTGGWSSGSRRRSARGHLRHGHPRRRDQRADPHRAAVRADEVRRGAHPAAAGPRVPPIAGAGGSGRVRHDRAPS